MQGSFLQRFAFSTTKLPAFGRLAVLVMLAGAPMEVRADVVPIESDAGLPDKFITAIAKDARGLMWIATRGGLCIFDGQRFDAAIPGIPAGLPVSKILYRQSDDRLWVATDRGLYAVRCTANAATSLANAAAWSRGPVADILLMPDGRLCAAYRRGEIAVVEGTDRLRLITRDTLAFGLSASHEPRLLCLATGAIGRNLNTSARISFLRQSSSGDKLLIGRTGGGWKSATHKAPFPFFLPPHRCWRGCAT